MNLQDTPKAVFRGSVPGKEAVVFMRLFATMIQAGLPLVQTLNVLVRQTGNRALRDVIRAMLSDVESGRTLASAMRRHPRTFPKLTVNMVAAGEVAGALDTVLERVANFVEKQQALTRKVRSALIYPSLVFAVAVAAVAIMLVFVIPMFEEMFSASNVPLPLPTRLLIGVSDAVQHYWLPGAGLLLAGAAVLVRVYRAPGGRMTADRLLLQAPIIGSLLRKAAVSRFSRTLATLVSSGVPILAGLDITAKTAGNRVIQQAVMKARASIAGGATIAGPLEESGAFPPVVVRMIDVGEQTGGLDQMLARVADFYDREVDAAVESLLAAMEPVMIVGLGLVVGGMIVAMYLPIFSMMGAVG